MRYFVPGFYWGIYVGNFHEDPCIFTVCKVNKTWLKGMLKLNGLGVHNAVFAIQYLV